MTKKKVSKTAGALKNKRRPKKFEKVKIPFRSKPRIKKDSAAERDRQDIHHAKIRVIGIGGGGGNIIAGISSAVSRIDFWVANTDLQALKRIGKKCRHFVFGQNLTNGLGAGSDPKIGQLAAQQAEEKIVKLFEDVDLCIFVVCLGGGTGSGAAPVFAQLAKAKNCLTLGIFVLPFRFEGEKKMNTAKQSLAKTTPLLNAAVVLPNEKIFQAINKQTGFQSALSEVNNFLARDLTGLIDTIYMPGLINIDFADLKSILSGEGKAAYLASAAAHNENRAELVCKTLFAHPLNDYDPRGAEHILFNISSDRNVSIDEIDIISKTIFNLNPQARIIFGVSQHQNPKNTLMVTLLAVGEANKKAEDKINKRRAEKRPVNEPARSTAEDEKKEVTAIKSKNKNTVKLAPNIDALADRSADKRKKTKSKISATKKKTKRPPKISVKSEPKDIKAQLTVASKDITAATLNELHFQPAQRKSALELHKETEREEQEQLAQERKWDIPAFLRRRV